MSETGYRTGFVAVLGRPSVGKSTLVNRLVQQKVSITSTKPQTTRHPIRGILTGSDCQYVFVDTPGFQRRHCNALNRVMNRYVTQSLREVDTVLLVVEAEQFGIADRAVLSLLPKDLPVLLVINKIDRVAEKTRLLPLIDAVAREFDFAEIHPVSAASGSGLDELLLSLRQYFPERDRLFPADEPTDRSGRFLAAEFLREKLFRNLGDELPYGATVEIERIEKQGALYRIDAAVIVAKRGHKPIVIGRGGETMKKMASEARLEMEKLFGSKVHLEVWVKVRTGWTDDERAVKSLGYH